MEQGDDSLCACHWWHHDFRKHRQTLISLDAARPSTSWKRLNNELILLKVRLTNCKPKAMILEDRWVQGLQRTLPIHQVPQKSLLKHLAATAVFFPLLHWIVIIKEGQSWHLFKISVFWKSCWCLPRYIPDIIYCKNPGLSAELGDNTSLPVIWHNMCNSHRPVTTPQVIQLPPITYLFIYLTFRNQKNEVHDQSCCRLPDARDFNAYNKYSLPASNH